MDREITCVEKKANAILRQHSTLTQKEKTNVASNSGMVGMQANTQQEEHRGGSEASVLVSCRCRARDAQR